MKLSMSPDVVLGLAITGLEAGKVKEVIAFLKSAREGMVKEPGRNPDKDTPEKPRR